MFPSDKSKSKAFNMFHYLLNLAFNKRPFYDDFAEGVKPKTLAKRTSALN